MVHYFHCVFSALTAQSALWHYIPEWWKERRAKVCFPCSPLLPKEKGGKENSSRFQGWKMKLQASKASHSNWKRKGKVRLVNKVNSIRLQLKYTLWGTLTTYKSSGSLSGEQKKTHPKRTMLREHLAYVSTYDNLITKVQLKNTLCF